MIKTRCHSPFWVAVGGKYREMLLMRVYKHSASVGLSVHRAEHGRALTAEKLLQLPVLSRSDHNIRTKFLKQSHSNIMKLKTYPENVISFSHAVWVYLRLVLFHCCSRALPTNADKLGRKKWQIEKFSCSPIPTISMTFNLNLKL